MGGGLGRWLRFNHGQDWVRVQRDPSFLLEILETAGGTWGGALVRHPVLLTTAEADDWRALGDDSVLSRVAATREPGSRGVLLESLVEELRLAHLGITEVQNFDSVTLERGCPLALRLLL